MCGVWSSKTHYVVVQPWMALFGADGAFGKVFQRFNSLECSDVIDHGALAFDQLLSNGSIALCFLVLKRKKISSRTMAAFF